jgi:DDE_Tnp_1-associated
LRRCRGSTVESSGLAGKEVSMPSPLSIATFFADLPDPRRDGRNKKHTLIDVLVVAPCGAIAGCESAMEIEAYGRTKEVESRCGAVV